MPAPGNPGTPQATDPALSPKAKRWLKIGGGALLALYILALLVEPGKEEPATARFQSAAAAKKEAESGASGAPKGLAAYAWIDTNRVDSSEPLTMWVTFENHTADAIHKLHFVQFNAPGFAVPECWYANTCMEGGEASATEHKLPDTLAAGESATVWAKLKPAAESGRYTVLAVFAWQQGKEDFRSAVSAGPVEVTAWWREAIQFVGKPLRELVQGLALPAVLILLGWYFQRRDKEREEARKVHDNEQDERRQIWNSLLPGLLENAQKYYMPVNRSVKNLLQASAKARTSKKATDAREYTYSLLICCRRFRAVREHLGGFHFKDRDGERVTVLAWTILNHHVDSRFALRDKDEMLDLLDPMESFARFEERFRHWGSKELVTKLETQAVAWLTGDAQGSFAEVEPVLEILRCVLDYEINRPFFYWYDTKEKLNATRCGDGLKKLPAEPAATVADIKTALTAYLAKEA